LAATARSGVQSQQDDARVCAELILVRVSSAAHSREHDADVQAALLRYEGHSQLTDDIFLYKRELTEVGKDLRAHTWWKKNEGLKLRRFICLLNKRIVNLQK
jgi:hypothetical protein